jgi:hypothetical protein
MMVRRCKMKATDLIRHMDDRKKIRCGCGVTWLTGFQGPSDMNAVSMLLFADGELKVVDGESKESRRFDTITYDSETGEKRITNVLTCQRCGCVIAINNPDEVGYFPKNIMEV